MIAVAHFIDILPSSFRKSPAAAVPLGFTYHARKHKGYISGALDGIVTVSGKPEKREIWVMQADNYQFCRRQWSLPSGHYLITELDPSKQYLVMCRDLPPNGIDQRYEPFCWDYVTPATDLTVAEQQALWQSWQDDANAVTNTG